MACGRKGWWNMVIIKISEKTVQCSIAAQELHELGLTPEAIIHGEENSIHFMTQLNQEVGQQLSYDPENEVMMMSKNLMADGSLRIFAVKMDNDDIQKSTDRLRSIATGILDYLSQDKIDAIKEKKGPLKGEALNALMEGMNNMVGQMYLGDSQDSGEEQKLLSSADGAAKDPEPEVEFVSRPAMDYQRYMGEFNSLEDVIRFARVASNMPIADSSLYKANGYFYLMMGVHTTSDAIVFELRKTGIEYANVMTVNSPEELHLQEVGDCVIPSGAIEHLFEMSQDSK